MHRQSEALSRADSGVNPLRLIQGIFFTVCLLGSLASINAEEATGARPEVDAGYFLVTRVEFTGKHTTRDARLAAVSGLQEGLTVSEKELAEAKRRLGETGLYTAIAISTRDEANGKAVIIDITEKITLVPIPMATSSDGNMLFGMMLFNSDLMGSGNSLYAVGIGGKNRVTGNLGISYQPPANLDIGIDLALSGGYQRVTEEDASGSELAAYKLSSAAFKATFTCFKRSPLHLSAIGEMQWARPESYGALAMDDEYLVLLPGLSLTYENLRDRGWFKEGLSATAAYRVGAPLTGGAPYLAFDGRAKASIELFHRDDLIAGGSLLYTEAPEPLRNELRGNGFRTLPSGTSFSSQAATGFIQYEVPVVTFSWAVITACGFYEGGTYRMGTAEKAPFHEFCGLGGGARLYLKNIAIPAVGVDYAYNLIENNPVLNVTLGFSL